VVAHGLANLLTGAPMSQHTGFRFGSIAKVLTTTLLLKEVERGVNVGPAGAQPDAH
jgi:CubicO group peptidase (beta-lactamase class C family)